MTKKTRASHPLVLLCPNSSRAVSSCAVLSHSNCDSLSPPGNDLARSYGWGPGFSYRMLKAKFLEKVKKASPVQLDRYVCGVWCVVWCGVMWCGVVRCGVVWCGVVWCGVVWCGAVGCAGAGWGVVGWGGVRCGVVWFGQEW